MKQKGRGGGEEEEGKRKRHLKSNLTCPQSQETSSSTGKTTAKNFGLLNLFAFDGRASEPQDFPDRLSGAATQFGQALKKALLPTAVRSQLSEQSGRGQYCGVCHQPGGLLSL